MHFFDDNETRESQLDESQLDEAESFLFGLLWWVAIARFTSMIFFRPPEGPVQVF